MSKRRKKTQMEKKQQIYLRTTIKPEDFKQEVWTLLNILYNLLSEYSTKILQLEAYILHQWLKEN